LGDSSFSDVCFDNNGPMQRCIGIFGDDKLSSSIYDDVSILEGVAAIAPIQLILIIK
jgi:hypothetical protein